VHHKAYQDSAQVIVTLSRCWRRIWLKKKIANINHSIVESKSTQVFNQTRQSVNKF